MYIPHAPSDRDEHARFQGLSDSSADEQLQKSLAAIRAALELNPRTGYVKGSSARKQLEEAFESVPPASALELFNQLGKGEGPLGRLFQYRPHAATQKAMLDILRGKIIEQQQQLQRAEQILKQVCEEEQKGIEEQRAALKDFDSAVEKVCKSRGEESDQCQKFRFKLLESKMKLDDRIRHHGFRCP